MDGDHAGMVTAGNVTLSYSTAPSAAPPDRKGRARSVETPTGDEHQTTSFVSSWPARGPSRFTLAATVSLSVGSVWPSAPCRGSLAHRGGSRAADSRPAED